MTITFDDAFGLRMPATMSADEVLIRAREALIGASSPASEDIKLFRHGDVDEYDTIQAIVAFHRDLSKPLDEVAPHTAEDPDERAAYDLYVAQCGRNPYSWHERYTSPRYCGIIAGIKRGRELERGA